MPRVIVTTDTSTLPSDASVLLDEQVHPVHLSNGHGAAQLVERIAWAVTDAEQAERAPGGARPRARNARGARRASNVRAARSYTTSALGA
ncbi:MAG TPA: hypothetical protein VFW29_12785 [Solirubrobacteraceae bacterium]|nr:hypothetical protein [Solirubrobacteraceae bacterium]